MPELLSPLPSKPATSDRMSVDRASHDPRLFHLACSFTRTHQETKGLDPSERELRCLEVLYPGSLLAPLPDDLLAGRLAHPLATLGNVLYPEGDEGDNCGYGYDKARADRIQKTHFADDSEAAQAFADMAAYWKQASSYRSISDGMDAPMRSVLFTRKYCSDSAVCHRLHRIASASIDYTPLLTEGVAGMKTRLDTLPSTPFLHAAAGRLDLVLRILKDYARETRHRAEEAETPERRSELQRMSDALEQLALRPPETFFEALQLVHLYTVTGFTSNAIGRLDDDLGPFLARDLEQSLLSRKEATALLVNAWQLLCEHNMNSRMTLGGRGRRHPEAADLFCELALEATRLFYTRIQYRQERAFGLPLVPQVAFRLHAQTPERLRKQALDVLAAGATFPILYDDEANIPAVAHAFRIPETEAEQYTFFDCGEYLIHGRSIGTPSTIINLPKALEVALHNGVDPRTGRQVGPQNPEGTRFPDFESVWQAYVRQVEHHIHQCARFQKHQFDRLGKDCSFLAMSLMMKDCVERGRPALAGGCANLGGTLETYGNITVADSLYAIQQAVFEEKRVSMDQLIAWLDSDFEDNEVLAEHLLQLPKFGNDLDEVDAFAQRVNDHVCAFTRDQADLVGLHHYLVVVINNSANVSVGHHVNATADGRRRGMPVSNGHTPTPGRDTSGVTALVNSILKLSPRSHGGAVHNLRFSKQTITRHRQGVESILSSYFTRGGTQCMITITSREELEDAIAHPENYGHLLVRVGGYSARFIDLPSDIQMEIVQRNAY